MGNNRSYIGKELCSPRFVREILRSRGIRPDRKKGQNFLVDSNVLKTIEKAANLGSLDTVIEVGAGLGVLTSLLTEKCKQVYAIESDKRLVELLKEKFGTVPNLSIIKANALQVDFASLFPGNPPKSKMVANLPYKIAATLLVECINRYTWITEYVIMVQREVAERILAKPCTSAYSAATVKIQAKADVEKIALVSRNSFYPKPNVDSALIKVKRIEASHEAKILKIEDEDFFDQLVSASFSQRRKMLTNTCTGLKGIEKEKLEGLLEELGKSKKARAEELTPEEFIILSNAFCKGSRMK